MPILVNSQGERFQESDAQNIYNAIKSGEYQLENGTSLVIRDANNNPWELDSTNNPTQQLAKAFENGARFETKEENFNRLHPELSGVTGSVLAGTGAAINSALFGVPYAVAGQNDQAREFLTGLEASAPIASTVGDIAGLVVPGAPAAKAAIAVGNLAGKAVSPIATKLGVLAAQGAGMGAVSSIPASITELGLGDPQVASENFIANIGTGALIGAIVNPAIEKIGGAILGSNIGKASVQKIDDLIGKSVKSTNNMTPEQEVLFDKLTRDPELRSKALKMGADAEADTITSVADELQSLSKIIKEDAGKLYSENFDRIASNVSKQEVLQAGNEIKSLLKEAKKAIQENPESYDASYLKALKAAEKTVDVKGAGNIDKYKELETVLKSLKPGEDSSVVLKGFDIAKAKAIKEARTEIGYTAPFDGAKVGLNRTGELANKLYTDITSITKRLYGDEFTSISDAYSKARKTLDEVRKLAYNADGTVNYSKVKSLISENQASKLKLDDLLSNVEELQSKLGTNYNLKANIGEVTQGIKARRMISGSAKRDEFTTILGREGLVGLAGLPPGIITAGTMFKRSLTDPRRSLQVMDFLEAAQVKTANTINKIASGTMKARSEITRAAAVEKTKPATPKEIIKSINTFNTLANPSAVQSGFQNTFGDLNKLAPNVTGLSQGKMVEIASFMAQKAPKLSPVDPLTGKQTIQDSTQAIAQYNKYLDAVTDPIKALEQLDSGINVTQNREVLLTLFPNIYSQYASRKIQSLQGKDLSTEEKRNLNFILGTQMEDFTLPTVTNNVLTLGNSNQTESQKPVDTTQQPETDRLTRGK